MYYAFPKNKENILFLFYILGIICNNFKNFAIGIVQFSKKYSQFVDHQRLMEQEK